ncbi:MAG: M14 family zinc carboxypeptidase, partial [Chloroflexota bacterium]
GRLSLSSGRTRRRVLPVTAAPRKRAGFGAASIVLAALTLATASTASAASTEFPEGYEGYHTNGEVDAALDAAVAEYGQGPGAIIKRYVIGQSFEGRDIWAVKISDNVALDEDEPEVLSESGMHAREHITVEMALYMIELLTGNYGRSDALGQRVTNIVDSREIWIIPVLNPDGTEFDISGGVFHKWRKNRQTFSWTDKVGIDLNRNFSFMWGGQGSAGKPGSGQYRGQFPFQATEAVVLRDFVLGRRVDGQQQIKIVFNWHSYGEFIMWPYGYTKEDIPPTMTVDDHTAFVAIGRQMAALNGYRAKQGSDSYIYSGDFPAWAYGDQRMFVYTFEMYPKWGCNGCGGFRPPDEVLRRETTRNTEAVLHFLEQADCPYRAAGLGATHCGPINDDFETDRGWTVDQFSTDTATGGAWERGIPQRTATSSGAKQKGAVTSGQADLVTGRLSGGSVGANDVDGGTTSALSPDVDLGAGGWKLNFRFTFAHGPGATGDFLRISVVDGATVTPIWTLAGRATYRNAKWRARSLPLDAWAGKTVRLLIEAGDVGAENVLEAAIDDLRVYRP